VVVDVVRRLVVVREPAGFVAVFLLDRFAAGFAAAGFAAAGLAAGVFAAALVDRVAGFVAGFVADFAAVFGFAAGLRVVLAAAGLAVAAVAGFAAAAGLALAGREAAALAAVARFDAGFRAVVAGFRVVAAAGFVAGLAAVAFDTGARRRAGLRLAGAFLAAGAVLTGVTAVAAWAAAAKTPFAAPPMASPTLLAAEPAAEVATDAILDASEVTSAAASSACFRRFAISAAAWGPRAAATWRSRFDSVFRAAASPFSSLRSSLAAAFGNGVTTPLASTMTPETASITISIRPLFDADPSPLLAIDGPPLTWGGSVVTDRRRKQSLPRSARLPASRTLGSLTKW
jgi:hypothetical protein